MRCFQLDINVMWADNLKAVTLFSKKPKAYVEVCVGDPGTKYRTRVVRGRNNHRWDDGFSFPIDATALNNRDLVLDIKSKNFFGVRDVGRVTVSLKALFDAAAEDVVKHPIRRPSGKPGGTLRFSYKFWEKIAVPAKTVGQVTANQDDVGAVSGNHLGAGYGYWHGYGYPPLPAYGHAPATSGYVQPPKPRRKWKELFWRLAEHLGIRCAVDYTMSDAGEIAPILGDVGFDW